MDAETATLALAVAEPPLPVHVRLYEEEALNGPVEADPLVDLLPLHAPEAVQEEALVAFQVRVEDPPEAMLDGEALNDTDGAGVIIVGP